jgi:hypothetical protein
MRAGGGALWPLGAGCFLALPLLLAHLPGLAEAFPPLAHTMSRSKAAAIHLVLSATIAVALLLVMLALWYPPPYFTLMGGLTLVMLIAGCDVVLGPLMTLIVFKAGKKSLKFDLGTIALLQIVAMTYGLHTMFEARPVYTVFAVDRFEITAANEITGEALKRARPEFASLPLTGPRVVGAKLPQDPEEKLDFALQSIGGLRDLKAVPRLYVPYGSIALNVALRAKPLEKLEQQHADADNLIRRKLHRGARSNDDLGYVPVVGRFQSMTAIVDRRSGEIRTIIDVDPW